MLGFSGQIPVKPKEEDSNSSEENLELNDTYPCVVNQQKLLSYANTNKAPFSQNLEVDPTILVEDPILDSKSKLVALKIVVTKRPENESQKKHVIEVDGQKITIDQKSREIHLIPEQNKHYKELSNDTAAESQSTSLLRKSSSIVNINNATIPNSMVHVYQSDKPVDFNVVKNGMFQSDDLADNSDDSHFEVLEQGYASTIPRNRVQPKIVDKEANKRDVLKKISNEANQFENRFKNKSKEKLQSIKNNIGHKLDTKIKIASNIIPEVNEFTGFSRGLTDLVQSGDHEQPQVLHYITTNEVAAAERKRMETELLNENNNAINAILTDFEKESIINKIKNKFRSNADEADAQPHMELTFQNSDKLEEFLDREDIGGYMWEKVDDTNSETVDSDAEAPLKPSIIYAGCTTEPPVYAGSLEPKSMVLHACEIHQYMPFPSIEIPPFMREHKDIHKESLSGPVPLPFNPKNTGMPAIMLDQIFKRNGNVNEIAPAMRSLFNPKLLVETTTKSTH